MPKRLKSINIDRELATAFKLWCVQRDMPQGKALELAIREYMRNHKERCLSA